MNEVAVREQTAPAVAPGVGNIMSSNSAVAIAQTRELAESIASVQMAKAFPRNMKSVRDDVRQECMRTKLAEGAVYRYSRKGATSDISGPSIRLAEVLARCMTNIDAGWRELESNPEFSKCEAYAWDKEKNTRHNVIFNVSHYRHTRQGDYLLTDARDLYEKCANEAARRKRACILACIPGDIIDEALTQCDETLKANVEITKESIEKLLGAFDAFGVTKKMIEERIQRNITAITPAQFLDLRKIYNTLKDGIQKPEDIFRAEQENPDKPKQTDGSSLRGALGINAKPKEEKAAEPKQTAKQGELAVDDVI